MVQVLLCFGTGYWLLVAGCWLLVAGCWLLVAGCWLLVAGCWLLEDRNSLKDANSFSLLASHFLLLTFPT